MSRLTARRACLAGLLVFGLLASAIALNAEKKRKPERLLNLNTATAEELATLPGIGEAIALRIIRHREKQGKFRRLEELMVIKGISQKRFAALKPYVTVEAKEAREKDR